MRAFLRTSSGEARDPSSSVEHHAEKRVPSSVEQPAETFSSIAAVNRWLTVQGAACNTPDFQKLRAAVSVLTKTPNPRREEVSPLCSSWNVRQYDQRRRRPLATLITELQQQAVITEGSRFRASLDGQTGAPASSAGQPAAPAGAASSVEPSASSAEQPAALAGAASSAEQPAVAGCTGKRPLDIVSAAASSSSTRSPHTDAQASAAQPGIPTKRQRVTSIVKHPEGPPAKLRQLCRCCTARQPASRGSGEF